MVIRADTVAAAFDRGPAAERRALAPALKAAAGPLWAALWPPATTVLLLLAGWEIMARVMQNPLIPGLAEIPLIGDALFDRSWVLYFLYPLIPLAWWLVYRTRWGLEVRSVGENPQAADVSGIDVNRRRRQAVYIGGLCAGMAGAYLTIGQSGSFAADGVAFSGAASNQSSKRVVTSSTLSAHQFQFWKN